MDVVSIAEVSFDGPLTLRLSNRFTFGFVQVATHNRLQYQKVDRVTSAVVTLIGGFRNMSLLIASYSTLLHRQ